MLLLFCNFWVSSIIPAHVLSVVEVLMFVLAVLLHGRQVEWTARLDFLWQVQANEEKREMDALQHSNKRILFNLLPAHVAMHFLDNQFRNNMVIVIVCYLCGQHVECSIAPLMLHFNVKCFLHNNLKQVDDFSYRIL